jgi:hypothetical protein
LNLTGFLVIVSTFHLNILCSNALSVGEEFPKILPPPDDSGEPEIDGDNESQGQSLAPLPSDTQVASSSIADVVMNRRRQKAAEIQSYPQRLAEQQSAVELSNDEMQEVSEGEAPPEPSSKGKGKGRDVDVPVELVKRIYRPVQVYLDLTGKVNCSQLLLSFQTNVSSGVRQRRRGPQNVREAKG